MSKNKLVWAELAISLFSFVEKFIPAALVAWNGYLKNKNKRLEADIIVLKNDKKLKKDLEKINEKYQNKSSIGVIDSYLISRELRRVSRSESKPK